MFLERFNETLNFTIAKLPLGESKILGFGKTTKFHIAAFVYFAAFFPIYNRRVFCQSFRTFEAHDLSTFSKHAKSNGTTFPMRKYTLKNGIQLLNDII